MLSLFSLFTLSWPEAATEVTLRVARLKSVAALKKFFVHKLLIKLH